MTTKEQIRWQEVARQLRPASALVESLAVGFVDNHGGALGDYGT